MAESNTHLGINQSLCGEPVELADGHATVRFATAEVMTADARGLIHGGFVFGAVDYAAMLAVNDPNVVLGSADVRFVAPVALGDEVICTADLQETKGKKRVLSVRAFVRDAHAGEREVLKGTMTAFVLDQHVLDS